MPELKISSTDQQKVKTKVIDLVDLSDQFVIDHYEFGDGINLPLLEPDKVYEKVLHKWETKATKFEVEGHMYSYKLIVPPPPDLSYCKLCLYDINDKKYLYAMKFIIKNLSDKILENYYDSNLDFYILEEVCKFLQGYRPIACKLEII